MNLTIVVNMILIGKIFIWSQVIYCVSAHILFINRTIICLAYLVVATLSLTHRKNWVIREKHILRLNEKNFPQELSAILIEITVTGKER